MLLTMEGGGTSEEYGNYVYVTVWQENMQKYTGSYNISEVVDIRIGGLII